MRAAFISRNVSSTALAARNYSPYVEAFRQKCNGRRSVRLSELITRISSSFGTVFTRLDCDPSYGVQLLSQVDSFSVEPEGRVIRRDSMPAPEEHEVKAWDVLIAAAGQTGVSALFGRSIVADGRLAGKFVGPDTVKLEFAEPGGDLNCWLYAFLSTGPGIECVRSTAYGTSIPRIRTDLLTALSVPEPDDDTLRTVVGLVRSAVTAREQYANSVRSARAFVDEVPDVQQAKALWKGRTTSAIPWSGELRTLSAWSYASAGPMLPALKSRWKGRLRDVVEEDGIFRGHRFTRFPCQEPYGVPLMSQRDVFMIKPIPKRVVLPGLRPELLYSSDNSVLVGGQGTVAEGEIFGRTMLPDSRIRGCALTEHLLRINFRPEWFPVGYAFLASDVGFRLLRSAAVGTKLLSLRPDLLRELPFPTEMAALNSPIREHLASALSAKDVADAAEAEAIRIVEEEVLAQWLT